MNVAAVAEPGRRQEPPVWVVGPQIFMPSSASFACSVARIWIGNGVSGSRISAKTRLQCWLKLFAPQHWFLN